MIRCSVCVVGVTESVAPRSGVNEMQGGGWRGMRKGDVYIVDWLDSVDLERWR
jgi:hypothetical protein